MGNGEQINKDIYKKDLEERIFNLLNPDQVPVSD